MEHPMLDLTGRVVMAALDGASAQQRLAANNIANIETPGYRACHARFEDQLRRALRAVREGDGRNDPAQVQPRIEPSDDPPRPDGNNVSLEREMAELAEATTRYEILTRLLNRRFEMISVVIGDGRTG